MVLGARMVESNKYSEEKLAQVTVGDRQEHNSTINLTGYDANWPIRYREINDTIKRALGDLVMLLEHVGSTSVPGLAAKPIIDIVLEVPDSDREIDYIPALESIEFCLRIREPDWYKHRLLKLDDVNLHVFSHNCSETIRMLRFRDWLRSRPEERDLYLAKKQELASRVWKHVQNYADAKSEVITAIMSRAMPDESDA